MLRAVPPKGGGAETPGSRENIGRTRNSARSKISSTLRVSLGKDQVPDRNTAGIKAGDKRRQRAGRHEGAGTIHLSNRLAKAWAMFVPSWNCSFMRAAPESNGIRQSQSR